MQIYAGTCHHYPINIKYTEGAKGVSIKVKNTGMRESYRNWTGYIEGYCRDFCLGVVKPGAKGRYLVLSAGATRAVLDFSSDERQWLTAVSLYSTLSRFKIFYRPEGNRAQGSIPFDMKNMNSVEGFLNIAFLSGWRERWYYAGEALVLREAYSSLLGGGASPFYSCREGAGFLKGIQLALGIGERVKEYRFNGIMEHYAKHDKSAKNNTS